MIRPSLRSLGRFPWSDTWALKDEQELPRPKDGMEVGENMPRKKEQRMQRP